MVLLQPLSAYLINHSFIILRKQCFHSSEERACMCERGGGYA